MIDHDRLFKELISTFFLEFLALFLPRVRAYVQEGSLEFLDKEMFDDITSGDRHEVDLLAKLRFKDEDAFFLVHLENQAQPQANFGKRMHAYFSRLHEKYDLPVYPIALFTFDLPRKEQPGTYRVAFPDRVVLDFCYEAIQLNRLDWRDFVRRENPVASALMAKMDIAPEDRSRVKFECLRLLTSLSQSVPLNKAKMQVILGFVDSYLRLDPEEDRKYKAELEKLAPEEKEKIMEVAMSWWEQAEQKGLEQGREQGLERGLEQGLQQGKQRMLSLLTRQVEKRLGPIDAKLQARISGLNLDQIESLGDAVLDFDSPDDLRNWLERA